MSESGFSELRDQQDYDATTPIDPLILRIPIPPNNPLILKILIHAGGREYKRPTYL
jgi:hypothetical protein